MGVGYHFKPDLRRAAAQGGRVQGDFRLEGIGFWSLWVLVIIVFNLISEERPRGATRCRVTVGLWILGLGVCGYWVICKT